MGLPRVILVREIKERNEDTYLLAGKDLDETFSNDDGPFMVGTYRLVGIRTIRKVFKTLKERTVK